MTNLTKTIELTRAVHTYKIEYKSAKFEDLKGLTIDHITLIKDHPEEEDAIVFYTGHTAYILLHFRECCEDVDIESITGDLEDLVGTPILHSEVSSNSEDPAPNSDETESCTWTFYKLATIKGYVDIRWYGTSNGYYSEEVSFICVDTTDLNLENKGNSMSNSESTQNTFDPVNKKYRTRDGRSARYLGTVTFRITQFPHVFEIAPGIVEWYSPEGKYVLYPNDNPRDLIEISPYEEFKKDDPVIVTLPHGVGEFRRYFAYEKDGKPYVFSKGQTSWTFAETREALTVRKPTPEELL